MRGTEKDPPQVRRVQPMRQFPPQHAAFGRGAASRDDGDAAHAIGIGIREEGMHRRMGVLREAAMLGVDLLSGEGTPQ